MFHPFRNCLSSKCVIYWRLGFCSFSTGSYKFQKKLGNRLKNNFTFQYEHENYRERKEVAPGKCRPLLNKRIVSSKAKVKPNYSPYDKEIIFGIHPVYLALLRQKRTLYQLFLKENPTSEISTDNKLRKNEIENLAKALQIPVRKVNSTGMKFLVPGVVHQGVCLSTGLLPLLEWQENIEEEEESHNSTNLPLWLVLDELMDPMNVGAIVRSAHYFGVSKIFVVKGNSCKLSPVVSKASSGALEIMDIYQIERLEEFIQSSSYGAAFQKKKGWDIISTMTYCEDSVNKSQLVVNASDVKISKPIILILGNEGRGVSKDISSLCDIFISIYPPRQLHHGIDSLNVSVATGVILHALTNEKHFKDTS